MASEAAMRVLRQMQKSRFIEKARPIVDPAGAGEMAYRGLEDTLWRGPKQKGLAVKDWFTGGEESADFTAQQNLEEELYRKRLSPDEGIEWSRMGGKMAPYLLAPGTLPKSLAGATGVGALEGLVSGGLEYSPQGAGSAEDIMNTGISGAFGAAAPAFMRAGSQAVGKVIEFVKRLGGDVRSDVDVDTAIEIMFREEGINPENVSDAYKQQLRESISSAMETSNLSQEALGRKALFDKLGFEGDSAPTTGQLTRDPLQLAEEERLKASPTGEGPFTRRHAAQRKQFIKLKDQMDEAIGGLGADDVDVTSNFFDKVDNIWRESQSEVSKLYRAAGKANPDAAAIPQNLNDFLDEMVQYGDHKSIGGKPIYDQMRSFINNSATDADGNLDNVNMRVIENMRKRLVNLHKSSEPSVRYFAKEATEALGKDIDAAGDVFAEARRAAADRFRQFESQSLDKIRRDVINESGFIKNQIIGGRPKDIERMRDLMLRNGGEQEWVDIKGRAFKHIMGRGFGDIDSPESTFSGKRLSDFLKKIGDTKLRTIFDESEIERMHDMATTGKFAISQSPDVRYRPSDPGGNIAHMMEQQIPGGQLSSSIIGSLRGIPEKIRINQGINASLGGQLSPIQRRAQEQMSIDQWRDPMLSAFEGRVPFFSQLAYDDED